MGNPVNLFPARVAFVNQDGTLTAEAYRALTALLYRVGGQSSNAVPASTDLETIFGAFVSESQQELSFDAVQAFPVTSETIENFAMVSEPQSQELPIIQLQAPQAEFFDVPVIGQEKRTYLSAQTPTVGASPWTYTATGDCEVSVYLGTVSLTEYIRNGVAYGISGRGLISLSENDSIRITYTVAPTVYIIPR